MESKQDDFPHAVDSANAFQSGPPGTDDKRNIAGATASVCAHSCSLRSSMNGTVVVTEATGGSRAS